MDEDRKILEKAKLAEQAEKYKDMKDCMKEYAQRKKVLNDEERNLLSVAYKNVVGVERSAWRVVSSLEQKGYDDTPRKEIAQNYRKEIEVKLREICSEILELLDNVLIPSTKDGEAGDEGADKEQVVARAGSAVFYLKMKADYHRYLCEVASDDSRKDDIEKSEEAYKAAAKHAEELAVTNPIRLGLALNFSVFYYEIANEPEKACKFAKTAFDDAVSQLDNDGERFKDSTLILQLLRDNLTLWSSEIQPNDDEDN